MFLIILTLLHILKPENDPSWRLISEYALGNYGWLMSIDFILWAVATTSIFVALRPHVSGTAGRIGRWLLLLVACGMLIAFIFTTDPGYARDLTTSGRLHSLGGSLMIFLTPPLLILLTSSISHKHEWQSVRLLLWGLTVIVAASFIVFISILVSAGTSVLNPNMLVGWPNRILVIGYSLWVVTISLHMLRLNQRSE